MIYVASPYSCAALAVREGRFEMACRATAQLIRTGELAFSPIVHSHPLVKFGLPTDWDFWQRCDQSLMSCCQEIVVLQLDGWRRAVACRPRSTWRLSWTCRFVTSIRCASTGTSRESNDRP